MKTTSIKNVSILFIIALFSACGIEMFNGVQGNNNVIRKNRSSATEFSKIKVSNGLDVEIFQGDENKIIVEADENLHDLIFTEVENGVLRIYSEKSIWRAASKKVFVTVKKLTEINATSGSFIKTEGTLKSDTLLVIATSGSDINLSVKGNAISTVATSGADLKISGYTNSHNASATSGSSIRATSLESDDVSASVTSGADIEIFASENLNASATSGGNIDYSGNPKKVTKKTTSGGSVSKN